MTAHSTGLQLLATACMAAGAAYIPRTAVGRVSAHSTGLQLLAVACMAAGATSRQWGWERLWMIRKEATTYVKASSMSKLP